MQKRPDASMSLLTDLQEGALEPEYRTASTHHGRSRVTLAITLLLLGALFTFAVVQTTGGTDQRAAARAELVERIEAERTRQVDLQAETEQLADTNRELAEEALDDPELRDQVAALELISGGSPVRGPGVAITINDAQGGAAEGRVLDSDLSILVNGLRQAGAEAIAINGRRLTTLTAIRTAGSAITVDYVSLSPPYLVEAIGNPRTLQARFARTSAASWWQYLIQNYGLSMTIAQPEDDLALVADPGMTLRHARVGEG